ncbi:unnamed protein product, partial [Ectocarpus fasciculatus]
RTHQQPQEADQAPVSCGGAGRGQNDGGGGREGRGGEEGEDGHAGFHPEATAAAAAAPAAPAPAPAAAAAAAAQQQQKRNVPPSLQKQPPTPRVSIKLPSAARRNARTPTEVAKASAAPVPAATILRGPSTAHRASGNGNGYSDDGSDKDDYRFLKDSFFSFCDDEIERLSSSPLGSSVKAAQEATEFSQKVTDALAATQRLLATKKGTSGDKTRDIDEARIQQLSIKAMKAVTVASWVAAAAAAAAAKDTTAREDLQARASTVAGTAAGSCSQPTPNSTRPAMRKWRRMPRNANASAAAPPAGTTQTGERGIPTTAGMALHQKRGIDAAGTMATDAKPTPARKISSDENEAALAMVALTTPTVTRTPALAAREKQAMRPISGPAGRATVPACFSRNISAGSPTVAAVAMAAAGVVSIGASPWSRPPAPAALPVPVAVPAVGVHAAMDKEQARSTTAASALATMHASPWAMPPAPAALPVPAVVPAIGGLSAMDEEQTCSTAAASVVTAMPASPLAMPPAPAALPVPAVVPAVGASAAMAEEQTCSTAIAAAAPVKTASLWSMAAPLAAQPVQGAYAGIQDGATGVRGREGEEKEVMVDVMLTLLGYNPEEASAALTAAKAGAAAAAAAAARTAAAKVAAVKKAAAKSSASAPAPAAVEPVAAVAAAAPAPAAVSAAAAVTVAAVKVQPASTATAPFFEPRARLASPRPPKAALTRPTAVQQTAKPCPAAGQTVYAPPIVESVGQEAQDEPNRVLAAGGSENGGVGGSAEPQDTVSLPSLAPPAPSKTRQTAAAVAESLAAKTKGKGPLFGLVGTNSSPPDTTCTPVTGTAVADPAVEPSKGCIAGSRGGAFDGKDQGTSSTSSRDTAQLLLLRDRAVLRERKRAEMKMASRSSLLTTASPARAAAARTRTRARFSRQARAARKALRREDVMSRRTSVLWQGDGSNNDGMATVGKEGEEGEENRGNMGDGKVTTSHGAVEVSQTQSWSLSAEIVQRPQQQQQQQQQQQKQQERMSTRIRMYRIVSDIRTVRREFKTEAFRWRVWQASASRQSEV